MRFISIVGACFNEADNIEEFVARTQAAMEQLPYRYELILIDNCSTDGTGEIVRRLAAKDERVKVILNARNFGHVRSPVYGLLQASGECALLLASDLQDPPELIPTFLAKWEEGFKAVVGVKGESEETPLFFFIRKSYYNLVHRLAEYDIIRNFTGFGLYDQVILDYCRTLEDPYPYFRGLISEIGLPIASIPFTQTRRKRGVTKNNFYTLYDMAMLGITNHSKVPLRLATMMGFGMSLLSLLVAFGYLIYKLVFWYSFPVGQAPMIIGLFLFSSVQLFFIGILGEYIGAIHTQVLRRPLVVEKERINF
ncbi:MAG: glycosyltransferase family 2 protein [Chthoniobacterales bacterium]